MEADGTIHTHRYQRWSGNLGSGRWTWLAIVVSGVRMRLKSTRNVIMLLPSLGMLTAATAFFYVLMLLEQLAGSREAQGLYDFVFNFLRVDVRSVSKLAELRPVLWSSVFSLMIKIELFYLMIVIARLGPGLIADDLKAKALPIYFARPINPLTYLLGKWLTLGTFIAVVILLPNVLALAVGTLVTGGLPTLAATFELAWKLTAIGLLATLVGGLLMLAISSLTADKRYVIVGWLAAMLIPAIAQKILFEALPAEATSAWLGSVSLPADFMLIADGLLNLRAALEHSGLPPEAYRAALGRPVQPAYPLIVLAAVTCVAAAICYRRVLQFCRSAANL